jgi:uncharacterized membrane protein YeaQ/YmgE (transglycosylase-associated protein family)
MEAVMAILVWIVFGLVVGLLARAIMPGRQRMGVIMTTVLGVAGSLLGGFVASMLVGSPATGFEGAGFVGSLIGAIALLALVSAVNHRRILA